MIPARARRVAHLCDHADNRLSVSAPSIDVDTTNGYAPALPDIVAFVSGS